MQHHQLNATVNRKKDKRDLIILRTQLTVLQYHSNRVDLCNGKIVSKYISMKNEIIVVIVIVMIIIATVRTII